MFSPTSIANFLACPHLTSLDRAAAAGEIKRPHFADPGLDLLIKLGQEHEQKYLTELKQQGLRIVEIRTECSRADAAAQTIEAIRSGVDAVYQPAFLDDQWYGRADFLVRVEKPSSLGPFSYEVVETKLARSTKARAIIQLCFYSEMLAGIQGVMPERMRVVLGGNALEETFAVRKYLAYFRKIKREFQTALTASSTTYPEPVEHCSVCDWFTVCDERWHADDHLSLVAGITRNQRHALVGRGVSTLAQLGSLSLPVVPKIERIAPAPLNRIREQARVQSRGRSENKPVYDLIPPEPEGQGNARTTAEEQTIGFAILPLPSPGDIFLDFEGDPFAFDQGLEYLIGSVMIDKEQPVYQSIWAFDAGQEKRAFIDFIGRVKARRVQYPNMHIYHYSHYEPTAIKHLSGRHGVCADEVDELLRAEVFVDLFRVVRQALRASVESYSIKKIEPFYGFKRTIPLRDATSSLLAFEAVLALREDPSVADAILKTIADYNRDDCVSTWRLRAWLENLRTEFETQFAIAIPRPKLKSGAASQELEAELTQTAVLKERLTDSLPENEAEWTGEQRARWLLAQLLEWHRREDKSMWWEYYRLCDLSDEELIEDKNAVGGLEYEGVVGETKRSFIHRYKFPFQDHSVDRALNVHDPRTQDSAGTLLGVDQANLRIDLSRGKNSDKPHPTALIPHDYVPPKKLVQSLVRIAESVAENDFESTDSRNNSTSSTKAKFQAARDLLLRRGPRFGGAGIEELANRMPLLDAAKTLGLNLDCSVLPIQGPPGSGKTYTGAHMIVELIRAGKRVGVTANSHKVISNLLKSICEVAAETNSKLCIIQKPNEVDGYEHPCVTLTDTNSDVLEKITSGECRIAAGTQYMWAREEFAQSVDVLFVDEAGQMSLANVLAISPAARSVVLLGDPQQLDQPRKGVHPPGAEVSALEHLLDGRTTIDSSQGLFLAESWRLHPDICGFTSEAFYDGRLEARRENARQRINSQGPLGGTGLRFLPVEHAGNQSDSPDEVEKIAQLVEQLLSEGTTWTNKKAETQPISLQDILIVAPYNAQVALIARRLPGARVGTVDKFQGQQAPVVFYSMTTSSPEDAPRGMEFLYSSNRLNVATSRAQCLTVLVANPALFDVQCKTPRQMELANAFCRYLEMVTIVEPATSWQNG